MWSEQVKVSAPEINGFCSTWRAEVRHPASQAPSLLLWSMFTQSSWTHRCPLGKLFSVALTFFMSLLCWAKWYPVYH